MNYIKIAARNPEIIIWSDASIVELIRNAKTQSIGISLGTFQSQYGVETYTLLKEVKQSCSISDSRVLSVGYRIKSMNGHDITRFKNTQEIKNLMLQLDGSIVEMVVVKPVGMRSPYDSGLNTPVTQSKSLSDRLTLDLPSMSTTGSAMSDNRIWDLPRVANGFHNGQYVCSSGGPPSTLNLGSFNGSESEVISLKEMRMPQDHTGDSASKMETSLADPQQVDDTQGMSRHVLELLAVKYPHKIRYEMPFKVVLNKNCDGRLGFSYKIKRNQMRYQGECRNEDFVYDYLVNSITALPAKEKLQVGDCIQSVNHEPMTQWSDERLKELIRTGGDEVILFVQRPEALCSGLSQTELARMLAGIKPERCRNCHSEMSSGHGEEPVDTVAMETGDITVTSPPCSGFRYCRRRAAMTMMKQAVNSDVHIKPWVKGHRRSQSDSSVMFYQQVFQDCSSSEDVEVLERPLGDSEAGIPKGFISHALPQPLLSEQDLQTLLRGAFELLASVTLKRVPLVRFLVLSESGDMTAVQTLLRSKLFHPHTGCNVTSTVLCVDKQGQVNDHDTQTVRELVASGVTVNEIILAKYIAYHLRFHHMGLHMLEKVAASLVAVSIDVCGVGAALIGRLLYHPLHKDCDIVEVRLECLSPTVHMWPAARFTRHAIYFITFDLDLYLSQPEQLQQILRQLNVIRSYGGPAASVMLMTDRHDNSIENVTRVAQELHETCSLSHELLCYNSATDLPLFVREDDDWVGRDFHVLEKTLFELVGRQLRFMTEDYPLVAVAMHRVLLHDQRQKKLKTMSVSHLQWLLYNMFGSPSGLLQRTLVALHHSGVLSYHAGMSERSSRDPILDMFALTDLSLVEACVQLLCEPCPDRKDAWHRLLKTGFTDHDYLLSRLHTRYLDSREILAFLEMYHVVFLSEHQCLVPYHLKRWCNGQVPPWCFHTLYVDFHGFLPVYLGCHMICGLAAVFGADNVQVDSKNSATFSTPHVKFSLEMFPTRTLCKILVTFKTTGYQPYTFLADLKTWIQRVIPPYINWHVGPLCPNPDCTMTTSEVHVLNLDQSEPVYCGDELVCEDVGIQQWMAPADSLSCWVETMTDQRAEMSVTMATRLVDLPEDLFMLICDELRVRNHVTHRDWCGLAGKLGMTHMEVELYKLQTDPCASLLHDWGLTASVQQLLHWLENLGLPDLDRRIREYMQGH